MILAARRGLIRSSVWLQRVIFPIFSLVVEPLEVNRGVLAEKYELSQVQVPGLGRIFYALGIRVVDVAGLESSYSYCHTKEEGGEEVFARQRRNKECSTATNDNTATTRDFILTWQRRVLRMLVRMVGSK